MINIRTLAQQVELTFNQQRAVASLAGLFGGVALILAAIGLYGVTAYSVARRTSEIGVRMALGADRGRVMGLALGGAFRRVAIGLVLGLPLAVGAGYLLSAQLYGVAYWDPVALTVAAGSLGVRRVRRLGRAGDAGRDAGPDEGAAHRLTAGGWCRARPGQSTWCASEGGRYGQLPRLAAVVGILEVPPDAVRLDAFPPLALHRPPALVVERLVKVEVPTVARLPADPVLS